MHHSGTTGCIGRGWAFCMVGLQLRLHNLWQGLVKLHARNTHTHKGSVNLRETRTPLYAAFHSIHLPYGFEVGSTQKLRHKSPVELLWNR